ncbi:ANL family adenylate-forming protein [Sporosarcina sp. FSL K6-5500]|uniref:ANL family adenylate-forming protein n=1 Tax=Sporosarcina sp. FSL K6-5500 TaxID=2921558 RepID=UPI0030F9F441
MEKIFLVHDGTLYTYDTLLKDLSELDKYSPFLYIKDNEPYMIFSKIIHSLVYDFPIEILDGDFSEEELRELNIDIRDLTKVHTIENQLTFQNIDKVISRINEVENWRLTLYTSGTTGKPKKVSHSFSMLARNVKKHEKFGCDVWAFAFNPTHMAGLQVFLQALLNQNTIVYVFGQALKKLPKLIDSYQVTSISATPTFYRNAMPYLQTGVYPSVKQVTFGGEKYDSSLEAKIQRVFKNAKINNIYASTEAGSLFTAQGGIFNIKQEHQNLIKITKRNELYVHHSLLGNSSSFLLEDEWFNTGDLVEVIDDSHFKFVSRQSDMINIGGYKVNPLEVEKVLIQVPGIKDILVKGKKNSVTGEIVIADVIKDEEVDDKELKKLIKQFASAQLQEWKVPRIIKFVDELPMTRTGKKVRT